MNARVLVVNIGQEIRSMGLAGHRNWRDVRTAQACGEKLAKWLTLAAESDSFWLDTQWAPVRFWKHLRICRLSFDEIDRRGVSYGGRGTSQRCE